MDGLTRVDYPDGNYVEYSYDNACRLTKVTTPFGSTSYEYDLLDRLTRVVDRNGYATVYEYDANGNRTAVHYANGFTTTYDYDLLNRLIKQETLDSEDNIVVQYIYTLGVAGERRSVAELDRTVEYSYDSLYRLTSETITEGEKVTAYTYAYDNVSNRILKTKNGSETEYVYNALNQLVSDSNTSYEYDLNGNLVRVIGTANSALYEYNAENKLVKATVQNGSLVIEESYTYDYQGNRTSKTTHKSNGEFEYTKYLNDNSSLTNVLAEIDENGTAKCTYTIGADLISQERDGKVSVYLYDGHGSVVGLANESGVITDTYSYDAFGNLLKSKGSTKNCYRYCGEQFDETTGLYYLRARYMDTSTGRFISQDSYAGSISDPVSLHKYLYANANPVSYTDPSGYSGKLEETLAATGVMAEIANGVMSWCNSVLRIAHTLFSTLRFLCAIISSSPIGLVIPAFMIADIAKGIKDSTDILDEVEKKNANNSNDDDDRKHGYVLYETYEEFLKDSPEGKPLYSPDPKKWFKDGGMIGVNYDIAQWTYIANIDGKVISVDYVGGFPDFKGAGLVIDEYVVEGGFKGRSSDFWKAHKAGKELPYGYTWHHNQDGKTLQAVETKIHRMFTHLGGISLLTDII